MESSRELVNHMGSSLDSKWRANAQRQVRIEVCFNLVLYWSRTLGPEATVKPFS